MDDQPQAGKLTTKAGKMTAAGWKIDQRRMER
jgi:hypothetical protein